MTPAKILFFWLTAIRYQDKTKTTCTEKKLAKKPTPIKTKKTPYF
jgi:hypothetical protein